MWYVYEGVNVTLREIYYGVSKDPVARVDGSHCVGGTKAVENWDCESDKIEWSLVSRHRSQAAASKHAHARERVAAPRGYIIILTAGI